MSDEQAFPPPPQPPEPAAPPGPPAGPPAGPPYGDPPAPVAQPLPWESREELGFVAALVETVKLFIFTPADAFTRAYRTGDLASPILFAIIVGWVTGLVGILWQFLFQGMSMLPGLGMSAEEAGLAAVGSAAFFIGLALFLPILMLIFLFIWSGILHLSLMVVGGLEHSETGFEGTLRVASYAGVSNLARVLPFVGGFIAFIWSVVLSVIGITTMHRTTQGKAILAVLLPLLLCCVCVIVGVMVAVGAGIGAGSGLLEAFE